MSALGAIILTIALIYAESLVTGILMIVAFLIVGVDLNPASFRLALIIVIVFELLMQVVFTLLTFFVSRHFLNQGINVE